MSKSKPKQPTKGTNSTIALNRRARHEYFIETRYEAGLVLEGWEVKSLRAGHAQLNESYCFLKKGEAWLFGAHISPLASASTHIHPDTQRNRKLLLNVEELRKLIGAVERRGYALIPLALYWKKGLAKLEIALAKGKHKYDKRADEKEKEWRRQKERIAKVTAY
ncbi:SsrA-binding protein SmpB [Candidatus Nitrosacidococcus sp. I8]|uniref:SsrA-binding protein SmpB n=1 Tax=Candidatus Nitrosacidococcus sp. I8 TaxID=2942908 RepID=UPI0022264481|nr:SsrA-binding protein SmpB [Candidatus Nitrosacidococcus sp. I8]CAH9018933.1 SsrA-binding protein [Candidatus Nitrosacidococcus sp. I8]